MNEEVRKLCDQVIENRNILDKDMLWELDGNTSALLAGLLTSAKGVSADREKYELCKKLLCEKVNAFSGLRGNIQAVVVTKMMLAEDPEAYLAGLMQVYRKLGDLHKLSDSTYMVLAAMNIFEHVGVEGADEAIAKLEDLYKDLQKKHPFIVDGEDRGFLSMLAACGYDVPDTVKRIEEAYEACRKVCSGYNPVHSMAQILAFSDKNPEEKAAFIKDLQQALKEKGCTIGGDHGLPVLGALYLLDAPAEELAQEIAETSEYLKGKNGFKWFDISSEMRPIYAALTVFLARAKDQKELGSLIGTGLSMGIISDLFLLMIVILSSPGFF